MAGYTGRGQEPAISYRCITEEPRHFYYRSVQLLSKPVALKRNQKSRHTKSTDSTRLYPSEEADRSRQCHVVQDQVVHTYIPAAGPDPSPSSAAAVHTRPPGCVVRPGVFRAGTFFSRAPAGGSEAEAAT